MDADFEKKIRRDRGFTWNYELENTTINRLRIFDFGFMAIQNTHFYRKACFWEQSINPPLAVDRWS